MKFSCSWIHVDTGIPKIVAVFVFSRWYQGTLKTVVPKADFLTFRCAIAASVTHFPDICLILGASLRSFDAVVVMSALLVKLFPLGLA